MTRLSSHNSVELIHRADLLMKATSNRYQIVVQVTRHAHNYRQHGEEYAEASIKPVIQAVMDMSEDLKA